jgi:galactokinase
MASATYKTGKYSKYMPERLLERYHQAEKDKRLLELRDEIALVDARLTDLLIRVDTGEAGALWEQARKAFTEFKLANIKQDLEKQQSALFELSAILEKGQQDYMVWDEVGKVIEQRRKLVESERKRMVEMQQMITAEQAMVLLTNVASIIKESVTDVSIRNAIIEQLIRFSVSTPRGVIDAHASDSEAGDG